MPVWALSLGSQLTVAPAYDATHVYFSLEGDLIAAYDLVTGARRWLVTARPQMQPIAGGALLFIVEADTLTALDATDGSVEWQLPFAEKLAVVPVWDNGWLVVSTAIGEVLAFRATDGHLVWRKRFESPAHAPPALAANRVYVPTENGRIVAVQVETGELLWERRLGGAASDIVAFDERIYAGSADNFFYCLMAKDGRVAWRWRTGGDITGRPIADDERVYFLSLDNVLRALSLKSGVQRWMRPLPIRPAWGPTLTGTTVVVAGLNASARAFDSKEGKPVGETPAGAEISAQPHGLEHPATRAPMLLLVSRDIAKGAGAFLVMRSFEPQATPVAPLPNLIEIAPKKPAAPPP